MATRKKGMAYGELAEYQTAVEEIGRLGRSISFQTTYYIDNNMFVSDGWDFVNTIQPMIDEMEQNLKVIKKMSSRYGDL